MKIISKHKDYYDFCVGKYGMDEKIVYDRTTCHHRETWNSTPQVHYIAFCGILYKVIVVPKKEGKAEFYYGNDYYIRNNEVREYAELEKKRGYNRDSKHGKETTVNDEMNCPVVIFETWTFHDSKKYLLNPILKDYDFNKVILPEDCWIQISNWLSREKIIEDKRTNNEKIVTNGFDVKTSFRNV